MHDDDIQRRELSPGREDEIIERAVLTEALVLHPDKLTILGLALRLDADCEEFVRKDAVERAVRELSRDGLLHCDCRRIWPSGAAIRFDELLGARTSRRTSLAFAPRCIASRSASLSAGCACPASTR